MLEPVVKRSYSYIFPIRQGLTAQQQLNFEYIPMLENALIYSVQVYVIPYVNFLTTGGQALVAASLRSLTVTFVNQDNAIIFNHPLSDFNPAEVTSYKRLIKPTKIDLTKSYLTVNSTTALATGPNQGIVFNFIYDL